MKANVATAQLSRHFTKEGMHPYQMLDWQAQFVYDEEQKKRVKVAFPATWSPEAMTLAAAYMKNEIEKWKENVSLGHLIDRVVDALTRHGFEEGYFVDEFEADVFNHELKYILASQKVTFHSQVWRNIGIAGKSQQSCERTILQIRETSDALEVWQQEVGKLSKIPLSASVNLDAASTTGELTTEELVSPVAFIEGATSLLRTLQNGQPGLSVLFVLDIQYAETGSFIESYLLRQPKGKDTASKSQKSVTLRLNDTFMRAANSGRNWNLKSKHSPSKSVAADSLLQTCIQAAVEADTPLQFDTSISDWHTAPQAGRIAAGDMAFMFLDLTAASIVSINAAAFLDEKNEVLLDAYQQTVMVMTLAAEILVNYSNYPTEDIDEQTRRYRPLALELSNLGGFLLAKGLAYESEESRTWAAALTAIMTGHGYMTSAKIAAKLTPFEAYPNHKESLQRVLVKHRNAVSQLNAARIPEGVMDAATSAWDQAVTLSAMHGVRNAQMSLASSNHEIATWWSGAEGMYPFSSLLTTREVEKGDSVKVVHVAVPKALKALGYDREAAAAIVDFMTRNQTIAGAPYLQPVHAPVFVSMAEGNLPSCSGLLEMAAALQPFVSGGVALNISLPSSATYAQAKEVVMGAWKSGLKSVSFSYSKLEDEKNSFVLPQADNQTSNMRQSAVEREPVASQKTPLAKDVVLSAGPRLLTAKRRARIFDFTLDDIAVSLIVGEFTDGQPGELLLLWPFSLKARYQNVENILGLINAGLRYGAPLGAYLEEMQQKALIEKAQIVDPELGIYTNAIEYILHRVAREYLSQEQQMAFGLHFSDQETTRQQRLW